MEKEVGGVPSGQRPTQVKHHEQICEGQEGKSNSMIKANEAGPSVTPRATPRVGIPWLWRQKRWPDSSR